MESPSITVEDLSKQYHLGEHTASYRTLRESIATMTRASIGRLLTARKGRESRAAPSIWALKDVSLQIQPGEVVGIIGRNGAGKTTLLKILSRITEPTTGRVTLLGRVGSLLEVGTGFHPELTGRENIYLNGAILGMRRREIDRKFDLIVEFAEVARFIDTPVKRYSSGMYTRLAFSVAAHMEPEILLVDEVLAVGDLAFQKRCIGKMNEIAGAGRTVMFVSHNLQAVRNLCPRTVLLEQGRVESDAETSVTIDRFNELLRTQRVDEDTALHVPQYRRGSGRVRFSKIEIVDQDGDPRFHFEMGESVRFRLGYSVHQEVPELVTSIGLRSALSGEFVTSVKHTLSATPLENGESRSVTIECPDIPIRPGQYPLYFWLGNSEGQPFDVVDDLTAPLTVKVGSTHACPHFNREAPVGFVSIDSHVVDGE